MTHDEPGHDMTHNAAYEMIDALYPCHPETDKLKIDMGDNVLALRVRIAELEAQVVFEQSRAECHNRAAQELEGSIRTLFLAFEKLDGPSIDWTDHDRALIQSVIKLVSHD